MSKWNIDFLAILHFTTGTFLTRVAEEINYLKFGIWIPLWDRIITTGEINLYQEGQHKANAPRKFYF